MASGMLSTNEILVGVPGIGEDLYKRHQQVWMAMHDYVKRGEGAPFLFAQTAERLYRVRSHRLPQRLSRRVVLPVSDERYRFQVDLAAMNGGGKKQPVPLPDLDDWVNAQFEKHGYAPLALQVSNVSMVSGAKAGMRIQLQSVRATGILRVTDTLLAQDAFTQGIGRGKRFGFGMLLLKN